MNHSWDPDDVAKLRDARKRGLTFAQIQAKLFPHRTVKACETRFYAKDTTKFMWSPARDNQLLKLLETCGKKEISSIMGCSVHSVRDRMWRLGITVASKRITSVWISQNTGVSIGTISDQKRRLGFAQGEHMTIDMAIELVVHLKTRNVRTSMLRLNSAISTLRDMKHD